MRRRAMIVALLTNRWLRAGVLIALFAVATVTGMRFDRDAGIDGLRLTVAALGLAGPVVYVLVYAVLATVFLPAAPFSVGAGVLFGPLVGSVVAFLGAVAGSIGAFWLGRALGQNAVEQIGGRHVAALDRYLATRGFVAVLGVRLAPLFPYNLINLCAGVSGIGLWPYLVATLIGILPGSVVYATIGGTIDEPGSATFVVVVTIAVVVLGVGIGARLLRASARRSATGE
jgi:uncharacterized membrane protein YdjX (TVP38/TMEM64 family)